MGTMPTEWEWCTLQKEIFRNPFHASKVISVTQFAFIWFQIQISPACNAQLCYELNTWNVLPLFQMEKKFLKTYKVHRFYGACNFPKQLCTWQESWTLWKAHIPWLLRACSQVQQALRYVISKVPDIPNITQVCPGKQPGTEYLAPEGLL